MAKPILAATLLERQDLTDSLSIFRLELEGGIPDFEPGQFVTLGFPDPEREGKMVWRAYSIASAPSEKRYLELYIRLARAPVPGKFTTALWDLPLGATLKHRGVTGPFTIESAWPDGRPDERRLLLIGGGTGLAPFVSMAVEFERRGLGRELVLCHGASYVTELAYASLLAEMEERTRGAVPGEFRLRYLPTISRPQEESNASWSGETGRVEALLQAPAPGQRSRLEEILGTALTPEDFACFACGYGDTVQAVIDALEPRGFRTRKAKREDGSYDIKSESYG
jgi:ferredoxin--NADP+ reductase